MSAPLTPAQIEEGKRLLSEGASLKDLARRFNTSGPTIRKYCGHPAVERRGRKKSRLYATIKDEEAW